MSRHKKNVLIVDDEYSIRDSVSRVLQKHGYHVETACGGREALEIAPDFKPDVVLLDIIMPGMDGYEACKNLRIACPGVKIIYFTAKVELEGFTQKEAETSTADATIEKPASSEKILAGIERVL